MSTNTEVSGDEIVPVDFPTYYTAVPVWLLLAGITAQAYRLYAFLAEHVSTREPGKRIACPKQAAIARVLGLANPKQVRRYTVELEKAGAVRVEKYRYASGMRNGYRYHVRFNPPPGFEGFVSLSQFYAANQDVRGAEMLSRTRAAEAGVFSTSGGTENSPSGGTENDTSRGVRNSTLQGSVSSTSRGAVDGTARGALKGTSQREGESTPQGAREGSAELHQGELHQGQQDGAPSARSAPDGRRPGTGGARAGAGGASGASTKTARQQRRRAEKAAALVLAAFDPEFLGAVDDLRPVRNRIIEQFEHRTAEQLGRRVRERWRTYGYQVAWMDGQVREPRKVALTMLAPGKCSDPRCEDGLNVDTGQPCPRCLERADSYRRQGMPVPPARAELVDQAVAVPQQAKPEPRPECIDCGRPIMGRVHETGLCAFCRPMHEEARDALLALVDEDQADDAGRLAITPAQVIGFPDPYEAAAAVDLVDVDDPEQLPGQLGVPLPE